MDLREQIKNFREEKGLSRADLARMLGASHVTVWRLETGVVEVSTMHRLAIERALGVNFNTKKATPSPGVTKGS